MKRRQSRKGVLSRMRYATKSKTRAKKKSVLRKVLGWLGGLVVLLGLGFVVVVMLMRMFYPNYAVQKGEGDFEVVEIKEYADSPERGEGEADQSDAVADALFTIQDREVYIPLTAEQLEAVQSGAQIHASYTIYPAWTLDRLVIDEWQLKGLETSSKEVKEAESAGPG